MIALVSRTEPNIVTNQIDLLATPAALHTGDGSGGAGPTTAPTWQTQPPKAAQPSPEPSPSPGPSPVPPAPPRNVWTPVDRNQINAYIQGALDKHHGDVALAFADLRDQRDNPKNYYNTNMAIAADYLRARWDTQRLGPVAAQQEISAYLALKQTVGVPKEGPGPVSPYSDTEAAYMEKGLLDEVNSASLMQKMEWAALEGGTFLIGGEPLEIARIAVGQHFAHG